MDGSEKGIGGQGSGVGDLGKKRFDDIVQRATEAISSLGQIRVQASIFLNSELCTLNPDP